MSNRKTNDVFLKELKERNPNIIALDEYKTSGIPIRFKCKICDYVWETSPMHIIEKNEKRRTGCPKCSRASFNKKQKLTKEKIIEELDEEYEIIDWLNYNKTSDKVKFRHKLCGNEFEMTVNNFRNGQRCPIHRYDNSSFKKFSHEYYINKIKNVCSDYKDYIILDRIDNGCKEKIRIKHKKCGKIFKMSPEKFIYGRRCKYCSNIYNSKGVLRIKKYLDKNHIRYIREKKFKSLINKDTGYHLRLDFYLVDLKIAIEYDGEFHYKTSDEINSKYKFYNEEKLLKTKKLDKIKNNYCKKHKIPLLRISYKELNNCEKILEEFINKCSQTIETINKE